MKYSDMSKIVVGEKGNVKVVRDTPSEFTRLRAAMNGQPLYQDEYVRLIINGKTWMTDAEFERKSNREFVKNAHGDVLIAGLGIGLILDPILERCDSVTVIEKEADVIDLIAKHYPDAKVIHADIWEWTPDEDARWDTIYFDIWPGICSDDKKEATKLHRRFKKYLRKGGWMDSWCRFACKQLRV